MCKVQTQKGAIVQLIENNKRSIFHRMDSNQKEKRAKQKPNDITGGYTESALMIGLLKNPPEFFIDKPKDSGYKSGIWDNGMGFIYKAVTGEVVSNWYGCTVDGCRKVFNCYLPDGNGKLTRHVGSHQAGVPYTLQKRDFVDLLSIATKIGKECGFMSAEVINKIVPPFVTFDSSGFLQNAESLMRKSWTQLNENSVHGNENEVVVATGGSVELTLQSTSAENAITLSSITDQIRELEMDLDGANGPPGELHI